ncbi:MAG: hypothetical protein ACTSPB_22045 [Candidatus Thorarchaeota archaeon]
MTRTLLKAALDFIFGPLSAIFMWVLLSAAISITVLFVSILIGWDGASALTLDVIVNWDTSTLTSLPYFSLIDYIQIMWAGLLLPIVIAGAMYVIVVAQGTGTEKQIVDYFHRVVGDVLLLVAIFTIIWLIAGGWYGLQHDSAILHNQNTPLGQTWMEIENKSTEGLRVIGLLDLKLDWETVMNEIFPYVLIPIYLLAYFWLFSNIHAGWIGNIWGGS